MNWNYVFAGLAVAGVGLAITQTLPPPAWPDMPPKYVHIGIGFGACLIIVGLAFLVAGIWPDILENTFQVSIITLFAALLTGAAAWSYYTWQPFTPLVVRGIGFPYDYTDGIVDAGIRWRQGYAKSTLIFANKSGDSIINLDVLIHPNNAIIKSAAQSDFTECKIGPAMRIPGPTALSEGKVVGEQAGDSDDNIQIVQAHRLICSKLPPRAQIEVTLATVAANWGNLNHMYDQHRHDLKYIGLEITYEARSKQFEYGVDITLSGGEKP